MKEEIKGTVHPTKTDGLTVPFYSISEKRSKTIVSRRNRIYRITFTGHFAAHLPQLVHFS